MFYVLRETYYKPITVQYCIADCVSWVPRLTLLDLTNKLDLRMHSWNGPLSYVGDLLYFFRACFAPGIIQRALHRLTHLILQGNNKQMTHKARWGFGGIPGNFWLKGWGRRWIRAGWHGGEGLEEDICMLKCPDRGTKEEQTLLDQKAQFISWANDGEWHFVCGGREGRS